MRKKISIFFAVLLTVYSLFGQVSEKDKKNAIIAYNKAVESISSDNYQDAFSFLETSLSLYPDFPDAFVLRAKVKVELGMIPDAITDFQELVKAKPSDGEYWFYLAYLQFDADTNSVVFDCFNKSINLGYHEPQAYYYSGLCKYLFGDYQGAITDYTSAVEKDNNYALAYHDRGTARRVLGDMQGALYDYRLATGLKHDFPVAFNNMGSVKIVLGDYEGAIQDYSVAINLDPSFAIAYNNRGAARFYLGEIEESLLDFEQAIMVEENYVPALNNKASTFAKMTNFNEALSLYNQILGTPDNYGIVYLNRGLVRELTGDLPGACSDWKKALELGVSEAENYVKECK